MDTFTWIRLGLALVLVGLGLLAVFRAPHGLFWMPAVAATEWGQLLALFALLVALTAGVHPLDHAATTLSWLAFVLLLSPVARAIPVAWQLEDRVAEVFPAQPRSLPNAPARPAALRLTSLLRVASPPVTESTHEYQPGLPLDLFVRADAPAPRPVVIAIHGGSWQSGDRKQLPGVYRYLAARGYAVLAINYSLAPEHVFPRAREDVLAAVAWAQANADEHGLDAQKVVLLGRSAGAQLALSAGYEAGNEHIRGVVAYYPPTDMRWSWAHPTNPTILDSFGNLSAYLGGTPDEAGPVFDAASPINQVGPETPPTLLVHGGRDELVFPEQSRMLKQRLDAAGVRNLLLEIPAATHGCDANMAGPSGQMSVYAIERFLASVM